MPGDRENPHITTDIPDEAIAEALAAVEKHEHVASGASITPAESSPGDASTTAADAPYAQRERVLQEQLREERDLRLRALADLDNLRKRAAREREELRKMGCEALMRDLLPVLDNLDRALGALPDGPLAIGVAMTHRHLNETLKRHGLEPVSVEAGTAFDPHVHEAITTLPSAEHPAGTVVKQEARGYFLHDRLLRPASVVVASAPVVEPGGGAAAEPSDEAADHSG